MNNKTARKFKWMAQCLGDAFETSGYWRGYNAGAEGLEWELVSKDTVRFYRTGLKDQAYVEVSNLAPCKISNTVYHDPITLNKEIADAYVSTASNASTAEVTRSYEIVEGTETSTSIDVGASVSLGLSQSVGYGGDLYGVQGETSVSLDVTASFNYNSGNSSSTERTISTEIVIPPMTRTTITATKSKSKLKQDIDYTCELECSFKFADYNHMCVEIESMADLKRFRDGDFYPGLFKAWGGYSQHQVDDFVKEAFKNKQGTLANGGNFAPVETGYTQSIEFENAVTGDVVVTSEEIV